MIRKAIASAAVAGTLVFGAATPVFAQTGGTGQTETANENDDSGKLGLLGLVGLAGLAGLARRDRDRDRSDHRTTAR